MAHQHDHPDGPRTPVPRPARAMPACAWPARPTPPPWASCQAVVWREAYAAVLPEEVLATFEPQAFAVGLAPVPGVAPAGGLPPARGVRG